MNRSFVLVLAGLLLLLIVGVLALGEFPPSPAVAPVQKVLPNDQFHK